MLIKLVSIFIAAVAASLSLSLDASASSRFTVQNDTENHVFVSIFMGGDQFCALEQKSQRVEAGKTETYGCKGNGKGKCKIKLSSYDGRVCKDSRNTCGRRAIKMQAKSKAIVRETTETDEETGVTKFKTVSEIIEQK